MWVAGGGGNGRGVAVCCGYWFGVCSDIIGCHGVGLSLCWFSGGL